MKTIQGRKMFKVGEFIKVGSTSWLVAKVKPGAVLLRGWGSQKWHDIEEVKAAMEKGIELK